jgi:hypothetical protein
VMPAEIDLASLCAEMRRGRRQGARAACTSDSQ